ncbi:AAA family ATPase [Microcystis sp. M42BS1]|uniref:ATP-dependent nuclease n=1 Tax=Microcystis sp. M42BS1 TaxID=2771192 RepID=UPI002587C8F0|nr:AAA family ATPase [Microcystis sp. M42BS1]MCA2574705.1 AAA family ATPase [Microcystis sp. M42BS1]MCA6573308.1 AAA family ATPase [Pseudanabaena sp. M53BS1SP1A06MG]MCA6592888.1 AAA family ATPase [Pseudanabaena sp. M38BS1SP1A06MG]
MYISKIQIKGFRNFKNNEIVFNDGVNVIIGHNNAGKTNLIKALSLIIDFQGSKRLDIDDFNKNITLEEIKANPPKITISLSISQSQNEDPNSDDLVTVGNWLTKLNPPYEALLTYDFFLPEKENENYKCLIQEADDLKKAWQIIRHNFIRLYIYKIFGGNINLQNTADSDSLQKFDFQFLDAIRDVERDMFSGRNTLLREVLDFFMDYEVKNDHTKDADIRKNEIKERKQNFSDEAELLLNSLQNRMAEGKKHILSYAKDTGAAFNKANPNFEGSLSDVEMFSALKLVVEYETGIKIPATHNGLGYNNLIFMSLLLAKMQVNSDGNYLGSNAKVFPVLAIEEPEAHLHPAMQYKFLKFLKENQDVQKKVRQIFVTTHSTQITSAVSLDEIICLHYENSDLTVGYPSKAFPNNELGIKAKAYVQRFLDATKCDMLFAQKVILVEGLAEQLLLSTLAKYIDKLSEDNLLLEDNHITVINVGGRHFDYFLYLFDSNNPNTIPKKIVCLTDRDPERKKVSGGTYSKCYPFEYNQNTTQYYYQNNATEKISRYENHPNIRFFSQDAIKSKTFEYDLVLHNPCSSLLITESMSNTDELKELIQLYQDESSSTEDLLTKLRDSEENTRITNSINNNNSWTEQDKKEAIIAARYLNSVGKGENALELTYILEKNLKQEPREIFNVPNYIKQAIEWICQ